jgi:hypothetical protein
MRSLTLLSPLKGPEKKWKRKNENETNDEKQVSSSEMDTLHKRETNNERKKERDTAKRKIKRKREGFKERKMYEHSGK